MVQFEFPQASPLDVDCTRMSSERFTPQKGQVVTAQGYIGTFKILDISADGHTADIQAFSLSKQMPLGAVINGIPCSILVHFKEDASQAAARIVREATEETKD